MKSLRKRGILIFRLLGLNLKLALERNKMTTQTACHPCKGKGYIEIRDCTGEIQREETCLFCDGTGVKKDKNDED